jgi:hypothetical protein
MTIADGASNGAAETLFQTMKANWVTSRKRI